MLASISFPNADLPLWTANRWWLINGITIVRLQVWILETPSRHCLVTLSKALNSLRLVASKKSVCQINKCKLATLDTSQYAQLALTRAGFCQCYGLTKKNKKKTNLARWSTSIARKEWESYDFYLPELEAQHRTFIRDHKGTCLSVLVCIYATICSLGNSFQLQSWNQHAESQPYNLYEQTWTFVYEDPLNHVITLINNLLHHSLSALITFPSQRQRSPSRKRLMVHYNRLAC